ESFPGRARPCSGPTPVHMNALTTIPGAAAIAMVKNATPYFGDEKFLSGPSKRTKAVWEKLQPYFKEERKKGVLAVYTHIQWFSHGSFVLRPHFLRHWSV